MLVYLPRWQYMLYLLHSFLLPFSPHPHILHSFLLPLLSFPRSPYFSDVYLSTLVMSTKGYDIADSKVLNKSGQEIDESYLQRYKCVFCGLLLREACQLVCGDRSCRVCLPQT